MIPKRLMPINTKSHDEKRRHEPNRRNSSVEFEELDLSPHDERSGKSKPLPMRRLHIPSSTIGGEFINSPPSASEHIGKSQVGALKMGMKKYLTYKWQNILIKTVILNYIFNSFFTSLRWKCKTRNRGSNYTSQGTYKVILEGCHIWPRAISMLCWWLSRGNVE